MEALHRIAKAYAFKITQPYNFPPIDRDLAFKVSSDTPAADIEAAIREKAGQLLVNIKLFDIYSGPQIGEGFKSMAYSLRFRDRNRTLINEDVEKPIKAIIDNLVKQLGAEVRS